MGYTTVRDAGGLDAGFKLAIEQGLIPGPRLVLAVQIISPTGGIGDRVSPSGHDVLRRLRSPAAGQRGQRARRGARRGPHHGPRGRRRDQDRDHRRSQLARRARAARRRLHPRRDGSAGGGVARPRPARDVPRPRRPRAAHRARGRRRYHRARLLSRRGPHAARRRWRCRAPFFVPTLTVYVYHRESPSPHVRERAAAPSTRITWRACAGRSSWACRSRRAPTRAATAIRRTRSSSSTWSRPACHRCRRCARPPSGRRECLGLEREVGTIEKDRLADLVVVNGNPLDDITVLLDPARIELVYKGGAICADRRVTHSAGCDGSPSTSSTSCSTAARRLGVEVRSEPFETPATTGRRPLRGAGREPGADRPARAAAAPSRARPAARRARAAPAYLAPEARRRRSQRQPSSWCHRVPPSVGSTKSR